MLCLPVQCEHTTALDALHDGVLHPPTKIAVVGAGCSVATEPTAEISHYYNLIQVRQAMFSAWCTCYCIYPNMVEIVEFAYLH